MQPDLSDIRRRLTWRYGLFSVAVLLVFGSAVYLQVSESRRSLMRLQVQQLASAAAAQLPLLRHEVEEKQQQRQSRQAELDFLVTLESRGMDLRRKRIRWLDPSLRQLSAYGDFATGELTVPPLGRREQLLLQEVPGGLAIWRPVYARVTPGSVPRLEGYVAVALSAEAAREELQRLLRSLLVGGGLAAGVAILASRWMVGITLQPVREQVERLTQFTADASHELRHPLTAVRAVIGSLRQGPLLQGAESRLESKLLQIDQAMEQMARLVEDLLLLARLDRQLPDRSGWRSFEMDELITDLVDLYAEMAAVQRVQLRARLEEAVPVRGQPDQLKQLLGNLITNAIRFTPPGTEVCVGLVQQGGRIQVTVDDRGPGIAPELREQVFERFWQADPARSGSTNVGLGLAIARSIARAHGGDLVVQEAPGGGCRMQLSLPRA